MTTMMLIFVFFCMYDKDNVPNCWTVNTTTKVQKQYTYQKLKDL